VKFGGWGRRQGRGQGRGQGAGRGLGPQGGGGGGGVRVRGGAGYTLDVNWLVDFWVLGLTEREGKH
jgi:hypothetical protein